MGIFWHVQVSQSGARLQTMWGNASPPERNLDDPYAQCNLKSATYEWAFLPNEYAADQELTPSPLDKEKSGTGYSRPIPHHSTKEDHHATRKLRI
jgi:hypothetical protein